MQETVGRFAWALLVIMPVAVLILASCSQPSVQVRESVDDYAWEELSTIAAEIAAAPDDAAGLEIAKRYHLAGDNGALDSTQAKEVLLDNGSPVRVVIAGFRHDDKPGGGKAGITFIFENAVGLHEMNNNAGYDERSEGDWYDASGGWLASNMRLWLNGEFAERLPSDLRAVIVPIEKASCVVPRASAGGVGDAGMASFSVESLIGTSVDKLWLPASVEVGDPSENALDAPGPAAWTAVLEKEGSRYQLFADSGGAGQSNSMAKRVKCLMGQDAPCRWWLRSVENASFIDVRTDGSIDRLEEELAAHPQGVVPCFAL